MNTTMTLAADAGGISQITGPIGVGGGAFLIVLAVILGRGKGGKLEKSKQAGLWLGLFGGAFLTMGSTAFALYGLPKSLIAAFAGIVMKVFAVSIGTCFGACVLVLWLRWHKLSFTWKFIWALAAYNTGMMAAGAGSLVMKAITDTAQQVQ